MKMMGNYAAERASMKCGASRKRQFIELRQHRTLPLHELRFNRRQVEGYLNGKSSVS